MAIEAPLSRYKRSNFKIWIGFLTALAVIFGYDGYLSRYPWSLRRDFYETHTRMHLFDMEAPSGGDLSPGPVSPALRGTFEGAGIQLSTHAALSVHDPNQWVIDDAAGQYPLLKERDKLVVYKAGPDGVMLFNRISPVVFLAGAVICGALFWRCKDDKVVAEETELVVAGKTRIPYDAIERIDKTDLDRKGFFTIVYQLDGGPEIRRRLSDRQYDNLRPILDHLIARIT